MKDMKETKLYKMVSGDGTVLDEKKFEIRYKTIELAFKDAYNKSKAALYKAQEKSNDILRKAIDLGTPDFSFNVGAYVEANHFDVADHEATMKAIAKEYENLFGTPIE